MIDIQVPEHLATELEDGHIALDHHITGFQVKEIDAADRLYLALNKGKTHMVVVFLTDGRQLCLGRYSSRAYAYDAITELVKVY